MSDLRVALVGFGKIARDQHVPALAATPGVSLAAIASPDGGREDVPHAPSLSALLRDHGDRFDAVALCTPPQVRATLALEALAAGKHVFLEKPPAVAVSAVVPLMARANEKGLSLFAAWHSRYAAAVETARKLLSDRVLHSVEIIWREDVRVWHPGQPWIFEHGGMGVFDPGINALSILTHVLPSPVFLEAARLDIPQNVAMPIGAELNMSDETGLPIRADFFFLQTGPQTWDIRFDTDKGRMVLSSGGARLSIDGETLTAGEDHEYSALYARFRDLVASGQSDVDLAPLQLVADAFMLGRQRRVEPFFE